MTIRRAGETDLPAMIDLIEAYRERLADWRPAFWKRAGGSADLTRQWFTHLMKQEHVLTLISEESDAANGFLMANLIDAPPVYDIPGKACMIDDFAVKSDALWDTVGQGLLSEARAWAKENGAAQIVIVSPTDHGEKNAFLGNEGATETTKWWTETL